MNNQEHLSEELDYSHTKITTIPTLPQSLEVLDCSYTQIASIPTLPLSLKTLICHTTKISTLPSLPQSLNMLFCDNCKYLYIPKKSRTRQFVDENEYNTNCNYQALKIQRVYKLFKQKKFQKNSKTLNNSFSYDI